MEKSLVESNTRFAFKLFAKLAEQEPHKNIFISPASIALALAMVYNGAAGETARAMAEALELGGMSLDDVNRANNTLREDLQFFDPAIQLEIANSLWIRQGCTFAADFVQRNRDFYAAELAELDFASSDAAATINQWVSEKTQGKIPEIVTPSSLGAAILVLINAIYFKGTWKFQFNEAQTRERDFTLLDGQLKRHPLMEQAGTFDYYRGEGFQAIELPYGDRGWQSISMYVFLPDEESSLDDFYRKLSPTHWRAWMLQFRPTPGRLVLPRFKLEYERELTDDLGALGMASAFGAGADFSRMCAPPAFLGQVIHKTFVDVNEEGAEAAAVTAALITLGMPEDEPAPFAMVVDRPFFCAIRDNHSGTILFMGAIVDP